MSPRRADIVRDHDDVTPAEALQRHLIAVTQQLIELHGLTGLTTRQIAREARVSDGVLYNHFQDKDSLVLAALTDSFAALIAEFRAAVPTPGAHEVRDNLVRLAEACARYLTRMLPMAAGLLGQPELLSRAMAVLHSEAGGPRAVVAAVADHFRAEQGLGRLDPAADVDASAVLLFGACQAGALVLRLREPSSLGGLVPLPTIVDALLAGAGTRPRPAVG